MVLQCSKRIDDLHFYCHKFSDKQYPMTVGVELHALAAAGASGIRNASVSRFFVARGHTLIDQAFPHLAPDPSALSLYGCYWQNH